MTSGDRSTYTYSVVCAGMRLAIGGVCLEEEREAVRSEAIGLARRTADTRGRAAEVVEVEMPEPGTTGRPTTIHVAYPSADS